MVSVGEGVYAPLSKFGIYAIAIPENDIHPMPRWPSCCIPEVFTAVSPASSNILSALVPQPNSSLTVSNPVNQSSSFTELTKPPDPFYYHLRNDPLSLVFSHYGNTLNVDDAILAIEEAWVQSTTVKAKPTDPVGTNPRVYTYHGARFYIKPQARLNWKMFQSVTFTIMEILDQILHQETDFTILGDNYEGNLGSGNVRNTS